MARRRDEISGQAGLSPLARRQRRFRERDRCGVIVLPIEVSHHRLVEAAIRNGSLTETEALSRDNVARVAAQMLEEVIQLWL
jgi:hypothetical protein